MKYEYKYRPVLDKEKLEAVEMGLVEENSICAAIEVMVNEMSKDGWEPIAPFLLPVIWFRRDACAING